jgi:Na+-exporting ATPase
MEACTFTPEARQPAREQELSKAVYLITAEEVARELNTDPDSGLNESDAKSRLEDAGKNVLRSGGGISSIRILMGQIFNAMAMVSLRVIYGIPSIADIGRF